MKKHRRRKTEIITLIRFKQTMLFKKICHLEWMHEVKMYY